MRIDKPPESFQARSRVGGEIPLLTRGARYHSHSSRHPAIAKKAGKQIPALGGGPKDDGPRPVAFGHGPKAYGLRPWA